MPRPSAVLAGRNNPLIPRVDPEFKALIAPLTPQERSQLAANIAEEGCRDALVVWKREGILLDGHNRLEICIRLRIPYKTTEIELPNREAARLFIEENQIGRRNLSPDQRAAIGFRILKRRVALSKKERARKAGLRLVVHAASKNPRERERTAVQLGVSTRKLRQVGNIAKHDPSVVERIASGQLSLKDATFEVQENIRKQQRDAALKTNTKGEHIHTGDLTKLWKIVEDDSVDLILTDPPYHESAISLYGSLAELAARKLKPGGLCAVLCGQLFFDRVFQEMANHLDYYWLCGVHGDAGTRSTRIVSRRILNVLRPVLVFARRPLMQMSRPFMLDLIPGVRDKQHHTWGQGLKQFQYLVENLSEPGQLCVDPFVGGGTCAVACVATGRRFIGTELDPGVAAAARARVAEFRKAQPKDY